MSTENPSQMTPPAQIVVGIDGSESSNGALGEAARLSHALNADLLLVATWQDPAGYGYIAPEWSMKSRAQEVLQDAIAKTFGTDLPSRLQSEVLEGPPARTLIKVSSDATMLVVGSRGHGGFAGMLLGSVSAACAEYAHCPVLVYHQRSEDPTETAS
ncbi:MAG: universal stress protein [Microbacteriaceae bacterium]